MVASTPVALLPSLVTGAFSNGCAAGKALLTALGSARPIEPVEGISADGSGRMIFAGGKNMAERILVEQRTHAHAGAETSLRQVKIMLGAACPEIPIEFEGRKWHIAPEMEGNADVPLQVDLTE